MKVYTKGIWLLIVIFVAMAFGLKGQTDSIAKRKPIAWTGWGLSYLGGMTALYYAWYDSYSHTSFHWFDDNPEWLQMDKSGHAFTAYQLNRGFYSSLRWAGYEQNKALLFSSLSSFVVMSSIEMFDAYSSKWGASWGDVVSNIAGTLTFSCQQLFFYKQVVSLKFSSHLTPLAALRPDALGKTIPERILKDYNGQTYWLSVNVQDIVSAFRPAWLNISLGYSAYNMMYARYNEQAENSRQIPYDKLMFDKKPYRRFLVSLDINPDKIKTNRRFIKNTLKVFKVFKLPFPALEFNKHSVQFHYGYF